jgi:CRP-like cAMP-binding protein
MNRNHPLIGLMNKLARDCDLSQVELDAVLALPFNVRSYRANTEIVREGDRPSQCCYVVDGFLFRHKFIREGDRQIMSFHFKGDIPDLHSIYLARADHYLGTLTQATVAFIGHGVIRALMVEHPRLAACLWRETLIDAAIFREWIINIGRRQAPGRIAHVLCEQAVRLKQVGLGDETGFPSFITQTQLGDATGLSVVHVNRTLQHLLADGLDRPGRQQARRFGR